MEKQETPIVHYTDTKNEMQYGSKNTVPKLNSWFMQCHNPQPTRRPCYPEWPSFGDSILVMSNINNALSNLRKLWTNKTLTVHSSRTGCHQYFIHISTKNTIPKLQFFMGNRKHNPFCTLSNPNNNSALWKIGFICKKRIKSFLKWELFQNSIQDFYPISRASHSWFNVSVNTQV